MTNQEIRLPRMIVGVLLSLLVAGTGHLALGFIRRGFAWFGVGVVLGLALSYFIPEAVSESRVTIFGIVFGILAALDAWRMAELRNVAAREHAGEQPIET